MSSLPVLTPSLAVASIPTPPPDGDDRSFFKSSSPASHLAMNNKAHQAHTASGIVSACPDCGVDVVHPYLKDLQQAQVRIAELEEHINTLTLRATTAMEKATEYETSLKRMNSLSSAGRSTPDLYASSVTDAQSPQPATAPSIASPERVPSRGAFSRLIPTRMPSLRSATSSPVPGASTTQSLSRSAPLLAESALPAERPRQFPMLSHTPPTPLTATYAPVDTQPAVAVDLQAKLDQEQKLRQAAEAETEKTKSEIEELTSTLFQQANKLVADERKARDRLEKRVEVLERRDQEKNKRLGMLDMRVQRIERVRQVLSGKVIPATNDKEDRADSPQRLISMKASMLGVTTSFPSAA